MKFKIGDLVREHIESYLTDYPKIKSVTPRWCDTCKALIDYSVEVDTNKTLGFNAKSK